MEIIIIILMWIITIIIGIITILYAISLYYSIVLPAPYVPSSNSALKNLINNIENIDIKNKKTFYELGSGDGKVISKISQKYPHLKCIGIEYNLTPYLLALLRNYFLKNKVIYIRKNFFDVDLSDADIVFTYLFPEVMEKLSLKFEKELKPGSIVISNTFPIKNKEPIYTFKGEKSLSTIYVYKY